jgi:hypothetical protein
MAAGGNDVNGVEAPFTMADLAEKKIFTSLHLN